MLFPKYYSQNNKYGLKSKITFALCYDRWMGNKKQQELGKNPFNFKVPDNFEVVQRQEYEQKPVKIDNDDVFKADIPDIKRPLQTLIKKVDATDGAAENKENIPPAEVFPSAYPAESTVTYKYAPTMVGFEDFDKKYFLPKQAKKVKNNEKKIAVRNQKMSFLYEKLKVKTEKMQAVKNVNE